MRGKGCHVAVANGAPLYGRLIRDGMDEMSATADFQGAPGEAATHGAATHGAADGGKRDFIKLVGTAAAAIGVGSLAWPLIDSMNPSADVLALASVEYDVKSVAAGSGIKVLWRGKPMFIRHRTPDEIKQDQATPMSALIDPAKDSDRVKPGHDQWVVMSANCTHLGCVPLGSKPTENRGEFGGYACPCHGSQYDSAGRVRRGPAPLNLPVPPYAFTGDTKIKIG